MSFAPLVNWRNFTLQNLKAILEVYPDMANTISQREAYELIEADFGGYKKTAYQFACQLALEDRSQDNFITQDYLFTFSDENLTKYLEFWFKLYFAPNPFVKSEEPAILIFKLVAEKVLEAPNNQINFTEFFANEIGGPRIDILLNAFAIYGRPLRTKELGQDNYIYIKLEDSENLKEMIRRIEEFPMPIDSKDRHAFFERFSYKNFCKFWGITETTEFNAKEYPLSTNSTDASYVHDNLTNYLSMQHNRIIFGAPGTGKSNLLEKNSKGFVFNELAKEFEKTSYDFSNNYERVTFHPNYSYAQFVGTYKPKPDGKDITYKFVPGPFMRIWLKAYKSQRDESVPQNYLLIIEEINRANVAAVFGDVFQLLDRKNGISEYQIETSEDMREYIASELGGEIENYNKIGLPSNMYIWATMNSADQGVFPIDTAFKRRWNFEYLGINAGQAQIVDIKVKLGKAKKEVYWNTLRTEINNKLISQLKVNEDKLIGPFFLGLDSLEDDDKFDSTFKSKFLMYLYEDVVKQRRTEFFECECGTYSKVCEEYDVMGDGIFGFDLSIKDDDAYIDDESGTVEEI